MTKFGSQTRLELARETVRQLIPTDPKHVLSLGRIREIAAGRQCGESLPARLDSLPREMKWAYCLREAEGEEILRGTLGTKAAAVLLVAEAAEDALEDAAEDEALQDEIDLAQASESEQEEREELGIDPIEEAEL